MDVFINLRPEENLKELSVENRRSYCLLFHFWIPSF